VNFGLRVLGRRPDGYHELESLFLPLDLADDVELSVEPAPRIRVELGLNGEPAGVPSGGDNLATRAAEGFLKAAGLQRSVSVRLEKRIPVAAGLGGGSSDAAAVLRGFDRKLEGALGPEALRALALSLGADVPFFLDARPALVRGVGERCEPLAAPWPGFVLVLANPGLPLSTAEVFRSYDATVAASGGGQSPIGQVGGQSPIGQAGGLSLEERVRAARDDPAALPGLLENQLEEAALGLCPSIGPLRERLHEAGALAVGLSGSGATVFGVFAREADARAALQRFEAPCWARVARTAEAG